MFKHLEGHAISKVIPWATLVLSMSRSKESNVDLGLLPATLTLNFPKVLSRQHPTFVGIQETITTMVRGALVWIIELDSAMFYGVQLMVSIQMNEISLVLNNTPILHIEAETK